MTFAATRCLWPELNGASNHRASASHGLQSCGVYSSHASATKVFFGVSSLSAGDRGSVLQLPRVSENEFIQPDLMSLRLCLYMRLRA